jgi:hypothetical protein
MKKPLLYLAMTCCLWACDSPKPQVSESSADSEVATQPYPTVRYLDLKLGPGGALPSNPYVLRLREGRKELVFCGTNHLEERTQTQHPLYKSLAREFHDFRPEVSVNEGGDVSKKHYPSRDSAIIIDGEIGLLKVLGDSAHTPVINGDMPDSAEYQLLTRLYPAGEVLAYIVTERLMWGCKSGFRKGTLAQTYDWFADKYLIKKGFPLAPDQRTFAYFQAQYAQLVGRPFDLATLEPTNPFQPNSRFQDIGRASKEIRDQHLIATIDHLLGQHDRVFVVFGGWHLLTCEPGLREVVKRRGRK